MNAFNNSLEMKEKTIAIICVHLINDSEINDLKIEGIPNSIKHLVNHFNSKLPKNSRFLLKFYNSINVGSDLNKVIAPFLSFILNDIKNYYDKEKYKNVNDSVCDIINLLSIDPEFKNKARWKKASDAAYAAAYAAANAAAYAAYAAANAANAAAYAANAAYSEKFLELVRECK